MRSIVFNVFIYPILFVMISTGLWAEEKVLTPPTNRMIQENFYTNEYNGIFKFTLSSNLNFIIDDQAKIGSESFPFPGVDVEALKKIFVLQPEWIQARIDVILKFYQKHHDKESFFEEKNPQDLWKAFACRAFQNELRASLQKDGSYLNQEELVSKIKDRYIQSSLVYGLKFHNQLPAKKPPKFGELVKVLQPLMASFCYSDGWLAISECYASSEKFTKGKDIFRDYFLNLSLMTVMRRQFEVPFSEKRIAWSLLQMPDDIFIHYRRECLRRWIEQEQYQISRIETKVKVKAIPAEFLGKESNNKMP